jgi:hypothetical protein
MRESTFFGSRIKSIKPDSSLNDFARKVTSQNGEDGIIEKILEVIYPCNKWCVEFGSWDGKKLSNTFNLIDEKGYHAVLIESDRRRFEDLLETFQDSTRVIPINTFVGFDKENCLDTILGTTEIPSDFDVLSIDVDGNDYHIWEAVTSYKPKVVIIEFNPTVPSTVEFVQLRDMRVTQGSGLLSITTLAKSKGYELVAVAGANAFFVDSKYFRLFGIQNNSVDDIWTDQSAITHIFCGYDGTVFLRGCRMLPWQKIPYREPKVQQLPKWARKRVGKRSILARKLAVYYRRFLKKRMGNTGSLPSREVY